MIDLRFSILFQEHRSEILCILETSWWFYEKLKKSLKNRPKNNIFKKAILWNTQRVGTQKHRHNIKQQRETFFHWVLAQYHHEYVHPTLEEELRTQLTLNRYVPTPATAHALLAEHVAPAIGFRSRGYSCWYRGSRDSSGTRQAARDRTTAVVSTLNWK